MSAPEGFSFGHSSVAQAYDDVLVPVLFAPWARMLAEEEQWQWQGKTVVDVATGTGIVASTLAGRIGVEGRLLAADINAEMLGLARRRCNGSKTPIEFIESPAHPLQIADGIADVVVCQQGFQFFPDRDAAASEIYRVLKPGGRICISTWLPASELEFFGAIVDVLRSLGEEDIADLMRRPFDFMPADELQQHFEGAGFTMLKLEQPRKKLRFPGGVAHAVDSTFSTPIGPHLTALPEEKQQAFRAELQERYASLHNGNGHIGESATNLLCATKAA